MSSKKTNRDHGKKKHHALIESEAMASHLKALYWGLYHFNVTYNKGKATDPVLYFSDPNNQDLGFVWA
ncbi:hypothetical protein [Mastigocoleus sp. MO_188.B34]|uniref:hypothetical protein n=1 Tax=Mastigocoleus sp. MO_188.B34 TaxID=3036635 RepID=UPI002602F488|nr:hypothetical protein [Mastigocoleus sp. MO_188.B34]